MVRPLYTYLIVLSFSMLSAALFAQDSLSVANTDYKYREDQFYAGVTYNLLANVPAGVNLRGASGGIHFGFLRDLPLNKRRNVSVALGAGLSFDRYGQTLFIGEDEDNNTIFRVLNSEVDYNRNRFSTAIIEAPLELRWRTSTATNHKFWRIYAGFRPGYVYWHKALFKQTNNEVAQTDIKELEKLRLGASLSFGYGTFNFFAYYSINPFFNNASTIEENVPIEFRTVKLGIMFYIL